MAKAIFGEFGAFTVKNGIRYTQNNRMVGADAIPAEVQVYLKRQLGIETVAEQPEPKFPRPSEAELAAMRAASAAKEAALSREDFDTGEPEAPKMSEEQAAQLPRTDEPVRLPVETDYLEQISIHTADIRDIAHALYERFGLYSVYLGQFPEADEINPLTGEPFTKYHLGIAYQSAIRAQNTGLLHRAPEEGRKQINAGREASAHFQESLVPVPMTMGEARRADSFDYRTSPQGTRSVATTEVIHETGEDGVVRAIRQDIPAGETGQFNGATAQYDADEDEPLVQPNFSGKPIIRPNW